MHGEGKKTRFERGCWGGGVGKVRGKQELRVSAFLTRKIGVWRGRKESGVESRKRKRVEKRW
jgi:hypothetical protein